MTGFSERLSAIKAKQEEVDTQKREEAERAAESARSERESARNELISRREKLVEEFNAAEKTAGEANQAVLEADAFVQEQGDTIDPEVVEEITAMKAEAAEAVERFNELKSQLESVSEEIRTFEESDADDASPEQSENVEVGAQVESGDFESTSETLEESLEREEKLAELNKQLTEELEKPLSEAVNEASNGLGTVSRIEERYKSLFSEAVVVFGPYRNNLELIDYSKRFNASLQEISERIEARVNEAKTANPEKFSSEWDENMFRKSDPAIGQMEREKVKLREEYQQNKLNTTFDRENNSWKVYIDAAGADFITGETTLGEAYTQMKEKWEPAYTAADEAVKESREKINDLRQQIQKISDAETNSQV